jgi:NAD(P)-dependent dehydrogenase (short-subunit alcohol dehydrogenase family)
VTERTALVTGCSSGFGLGIAQALLARRWTVFAAMRDPARVPAQLDGAHVVPLDLADDAQIVAAAARVDRLDCLVNNAGFALTGPLATYSSQQMRHQMQVNVLGPAFLTQQLLPALANARGRVITVSSVAGELGLPMNALYCATKFALEGLSESLRHELAAHGVQVALVEPGGYRTAFARNMVWGERPLPAGGRDARQLAAYSRMQEKLLARPGKDPGVVVRAVVRLAEMEVMPMRTRVGADARSASVIRRWLPQRLALGLVGALFRRRLAAERGE